MREEYDFSEGKKNPYTKEPKTVITIRLDQPTVDYFKTLSEEVKMPYQTVIKSFLAECAAKKMKPSITWR